MKSIGIIGGGQLGQMMVDAAHKMKIKTVVLDPDPSCPCHLNSDELVIGAYDDYQKMEQICKKVNCLTYEFENVSSGAISLLEEQFVIPQGSKILYLSQNRIREKDFAKEVGFKTCNYVRVTNNEELIEGFKKIGFPCILKTANGGYDGKGQYQFKEMNDFLVDTEYILEEKIDFDYEISCIASRSTNGDIVVYPLLKNEHINGILHYTELLHNDCFQKRVEKIMADYLNEMDYAGTLCVELFVKGDDIIFNEMAPRPHNSGHLTIEAFNASQYTNHVLGILGMDLIKPVLLHECQMVNILGQDIDVLDKMDKDLNYNIHLYGKKDARINRKMGHITFIDCDKTKVREFINKYIRRA